MPDLERKRKPEVIVFAGPNGSGKSTITRMAKTVGIYINADDIKKASHCTDLEAAVRAEQLREVAVMHIYDNTETPFRFFKKRKEQFFYWESPEWTQHDIEILTGVLFSR